MAGAKTFLVLFPAFGLHPTVYTIDPLRAAVVEEWPRFWPVKGPVQQRPTHVKNFNGTKGMPVRDGFVDCFKIHSR
jgi:hypothetical protein